MPEFILKFSMIPIIFIIQLLAIRYAARNADKQNIIKITGWITIFLFILVVWGGISTWLAFDGVYMSDELLEAYPTFWLPFIPVVLVIVPLALFVSARDAVRELIDATPISWIVGIHALRILAIGTIIKAWRGEFSMSFATWVGIPDLLFGLSAVVMIWLALKDRVSTMSLMSWNMLGVLVILPGAPIVGQMGLPGIFHSIDETPSMVTLLEFPMVLAPSLVVPLFVMMNMFVAIRLIERMLQGRLERIKSPSL